MLASTLAYQLTREVPEKHRAGNGPKIKRGDEILAGPYPQSMVDFVGQVQVRLELIAAVRASQELGTPVDHILLACGFPGIGKTTLAKLTAHLMGGGFVEIGGSNVRDADVVKVIQSMQDGDVLAIDEIHRLVSGGKSKAEWLLTLLQDGMIQTPQGAVQAPKITVIAATTDAQKLPKTILDRFPVQPKFVQYAPWEAVDIATTTAKRLGFGDKMPMPEGEEWLYAVANATDCNPRRIGMLLKCIQRTYFSTNGEVYDGTTYDISPALAWSGLTEDGLTSVQQTYLISLYNNGGKAGASTLKALVGEAAMDHDEHGLIAKHMVTITPGGRELTGWGEKRAEWLLGVVNGKWGPKPGHEGRPW